MIGLSLVCWAYLIFILLGRIVNYNTCDAQGNAARAIDNITFIILILVIYFLTR